VIVEGKVKRGEKIAIRVVGIIREVFFRGLGLIA